MPRRRWFFALTASAALAVAGPALATTGTSGSTTPRVGPHYFPALTDTAAQRKALTPPAPPCPAPLGSVLATGGVIQDCHTPGPPPAGQPTPGNMAYYGGLVQTTPHIYLVFWGWGQPGAFNGPCTPVTLSEPGISSAAPGPGTGGPRHVAGPKGARTAPRLAAAPAVLPCDPDGAGKRMADFVSQMGGTRWAGIQTQYYQVANGQTTNITNPQNQLAGIWVDDTNPIPKNLTYTDMAAEAQRAIAYFGVDTSVASLANDNFVIAQPQNFSDPQAASTGYCAFHDYTLPGIEGGIYDHVLSHVAYTNMPYVLNQGSSCGQNFVNSGSAGTLDGETIVLGHEIEETVTDPGAEDVDPATGARLGGWYDVVTGYENGDKCAWVGDGAAVPGAASNIQGNRGGQFPVQALWSNAAAAGAGYCAGTANDLGF